MKKVLQTLKCLKRYTTMYLLDVLQLEKPYGVVQTIGFGASEHDFKNFSVPLNSCVTLSMYL